MKAVIHQKLCLCIKKKLHCIYGRHIENYESSTLCNNVIAWKNCKTFWLKNRNFLLEHRKICTALRFFFSSWIFFLFYFKTLRTIKHFSQLSKQQQQPTKYDQMVKKRCTISFSKMSVLADQWKGISLNLFFFTKWWFILV